MNNRKKYVISGIIVVTAIYALFSIFYGAEMTESDDMSSDDPGLYTCSMHPEVVHEGPGICPICGMNLVPIQTFQTASASVSPQGEKKERKIKYWVAPMDPNFISDKPGKSPMGMDLVPVYEDADQGGSGLVIIIDPVVVQNTGIMSTPVEVRDLRKEIRTIGLVDYDETRFTHIHTKVKGWIEKLYVDYTGQKVYKNQPLLDIYSPELVSTQEEYLTVLNSRSSGSAGEDPLLKSTRERLSNWDITPEQIQESWKGRVK